VEPPKQASVDIIKPVDDHSALAVKVRESLMRKDYKSSSGLCSQLAEKNARAHLCAGVSYFMLADYASAILHLEKALETGMDDFTCRKYLAFTYYYRHDFDKSLLNAEKGLNIRKDPVLETFHSRLIREKQAHRNFVSESTNHFKIQFDGYEHGSISRTVIGILEDAYSGVGRDLDYYPAEPITVILYTKHDFYDVTQMPGWSGGFFDMRDGTIRVPVRGAEKKEALLKTVLFHEYVHALIHSIARNCPRWLHEGMANYYARGPSQNVGQVIPMSHIDNAFFNSDVRGIHVAYEQSLSAVSWLMGRYGPGRMKDLLVSLSRGNDMNQAFTLSFQMSYTEFSEKWGKK
jgi:tetratricopeptide (TPR) repeat protein